MYQKKRRWKEGRRVGGRRARKQKERTSEGREEGKGGDCFYFWWVLTSPQVCNLVLPQ